MRLLEVESAVDIDGGASEVAGFVAGQIDGCCGDIIGRAEAERNRGSELGNTVFAVDGAEEFGVNDAGGDGVRSFPGCRV